MGQLGVSVEQLVDSSIETSNIADNIENGLRNFSDEVDSLLTSWAGLSAARFRESWSEGQGGAETVVSGLRTTAELLPESAQGYAVQEPTTTDNIGLLAL